MDLTSYSYPTTVHIPLSMTLSIYHTRTHAHTHTRTHAHTHLPSRTRTHTHTVSPHIIIETVRLWLQEDQNGGKFERVVFLAKANVGLVEMFLKKFFPLQPSPGEL